MSAIYRVLALIMIITFRAKSYVEPGPDHRQVSRYHGLSTGAFISVHSGPGPWC